MARSIYSQQQRPGVRKVVAAFFNGSGSNGKRGFVFFGGGTGGHLSPGLAVADVLAEEARFARTPVFFSGTRKGECGLQGRKRFPVYELALSQPKGLCLRFVREASMRFGELIRFLLSERPYVCIGLGGYVSFPGAIAARLCGIPVVLLEQNAIAGKVNRLLAPLSNCVCTSFPNTRGLENARMVLCTGNPVRKEFLRFRRKRRTRGGRACKIAVLGGSQGARALNDTVVKSLPLLRPWRENLRFVHAAGPDAERVAGAYRRWQFRAETSRFFPDMAERIGDADLAFCRAGGSTISELLVLGVPSVLIPYPFARDDHQMANARFVAERGGGLVFRQDEFGPETISRVVKSFWDRKDEWERRSECAYTLGRPHAARAVAALPLNAGGGKKR